MKGGLPVVEENIELKTTINRHGSRYYKHQNNTKRIFQLRKDEYLKFSTYCLILLPSAEKSASLFYLFTLMNWPTLYYETPGDSNIWLFYSVGYCKHIVFLLVTICLRLSYQNLVVTPTNFKTALLYRDGTCRTTTSIVKIV